MIIIGTFTIEEVLPFLPQGRKVFFTEMHGDLTVSLNSLRYQVFQKSLSCNCCGITGDRFLLQHFRKEPYYKSHLNLFAGSTLMTKDHIVPRSLGGNDSLSNLQTLCSFCNTLKGSHVITNQQLKDAYQFFREVLGCHPKMTVSQARKKAIRYIEQLTKEG